MSDSEGDYGSVDTPVVAADDIPGLVDRLKSIEYDDFTQACESLNNLVDAQEELATDHLLPHLLSITALVNEGRDDERRSALLELVCKLAAMNAHGRAAVKKDIQGLLPMLLTGSFSDRGNILQVLETMLEDGDNSLETEVLEFFAKSIYAPLPATPDKMTAEDYRRSLNGGEVLQTIFSYCQTHTRAIALKAKAIEFLLLTASLPDPASRKGAITSLSLAYSNIQDIAESFPDKDTSQLQQWILAPMLNLLKDKDFTIATEVVDFLQMAEFPEGYLRGHPSFNLDLVGYLGRWDPEGHIPFPAILFDRLISDSEDDNIVIDGFQRLWSEEEHHASLKSQVLSHLASIHDSIRQAAIKGGATSFVLASLEAPDQAEVTAILKSVHKILEDDQSFGGHLFEAGVISKLIKLFQNGSTESRCLAAATLSKLLESYSVDGSEPIRKDIAKVLVSPEVLPHNLSATEDSSPKVAGSAFEFLSNLISKDRGSGDDEDNGRSSLKDQIVTDILVNTALKHLGTPEATSGVVQFLTQACWEYPRGFDLVEVGFRATMPTTSSSFFAALHPVQEGRTNWDAHSHLISAAVKAGAFNRMQQLLNEPSSSAEDVRLGVRAMRALLWGEDVDKNIGRQNERLAKLITLLLVDGSFESLIEAQETVDMLAEYGVADPFASWSSVVDVPEVIGGLLKHLKTSQVEEEEPGLDGLSGEGYRRAMEEYRKRQKAAESRYRSTISATVDLIKNLLPIFHSYKTQLSGPLLRSALAYPRSTTIVTLESFVSSESAEVAEFEPLVNGARYVLSETADPPGVDDLTSLLGVSPILTISFYLAGLLPDIQTLANDNAAGAESESDEPGDQETLKSAIELFALVAGHLKRRPTDLLKTQELFFATPPLVKTAHSTVVRATAAPDGEDEEEDTYDDEKFDSLNMANNLFTLCNGYPQGIATLAGLEPPIVATLLKLYDDADCDPEHCAPLLGLVASYGSGLETAVDTVKQHIKQLTPPADGTTGGGGGKKKKKAKAYKPRLSSEKVFQRVLLLLRGQSLNESAVQKILGYSGALDLVLEQILTEENEIASHRVSTWILSLKIVGALLAIGADKQDNVEFLSSKLPLILERLFVIWSHSKQSERVRSVTLQFLSVVLSTSCADGKEFDAVSSLVTIGWLQTLVHRICSYPADVGGIDLLIQPLLAFPLEGVAGRRALIEAFKVMFDSAEALDLELNSGWGVTYAVKRILDDAETQGLTKDLEAARLDWLVEAGVVEYTFRLMKEGDLKLNVFGVSLAASVALSRSCANAIPLLSQHGIQTVPDQIFARIAAQIPNPATTVSAKDQLEDNEEPQEGDEWLEKWKIYVDQCSLALKGQKVDNFDKFYVV